MTLANDQTSQSLSILVCKIVPTLIKLLGGITESLPTKFLTQGQLGSKHSKGISYYFLSAEASEEVRLVVGEGAFRFSLGFLGRGQSHTAKK